MDDDLDDDRVAREFMARLKPGTPEFDRFKASIDEAIAELDAGGGEPFDFEKILREGRERLARYRQSSASQ
jgi:hypothetical protein